MFTNAYIKSTIFFKIKRQNPSKILIATKTSLCENLPVNSHVSFLPSIFPLSLSIRLQGVFQST